MALRLDILSPEATLVLETVDSVTLPGVDGSFTVLVNHAPLITSLSKGVIRYKGGEGEKTLAIKTGFVEILNNEVNVCVEL